MCATNSALFTIANNCPCLISLNVSCSDELNDEGLLHLVPTGSKGCGQLRALNLLKVLIYKYGITIYQQNLQILKTQRV